MFHIRMVAAVALLASVTHSSFGQGPSSPNANSDILKMIEAGLPESVIVNKIKASIEKFDTSVDALIALKKAGATEAELNAVTTAPIAATSPLVAQPSGPPVTLFDGELLHTRAGDPYLQFPATRQDYFPNGLPTNSAFLVTYKGEAGVLVPSSDIVIDCDPRIVVFLKSRILIQQYGYGGCIMQPWKLKDSYFKGLELQEYPRDGVLLVRNKQNNFLSDNDIGKHHVPYDTLKLSKHLSIDLLFGMYPFNFDDDSIAPMHSAFMEPFVANLMSDFDNTVAAFERAANIIDPFSQLSTKAMFQAMTRAEIERSNAVATQRESERKKGGNDWLALLQGVQTTQQMTSGLMNGAVGLSTGNAGQFSTGLQSMAAASGSTSLQTAMNNSPSLSPGNGVVPPTGDPIADALREQQAKIAAIGANRQQNMAAAAPASAAHGYTFNPGPGAPPQRVPTPVGDQSQPAEYVCPDVTKACIPISQYHPTGQGGGVQVATICPASGFIPGAYRKVAGDVSVGVPCTPGQPLQGNTGDSSSGQSVASGSGGSGPGGGADGAGNPTGIDATLSKHIISPGDLQKCTTLDFNGQTSTIGQVGWDRYTNVCSVAINVTVAFPNIPSPYGFELEQGESKGTANSQSDYARLGGDHPYVCPKGYGAADLSGHYISRPVNEYLCREHGW
jgi:hypothetical protein